MTEGKIPPATDAVPSSVLETLESERKTRSLHDLYDATIPSWSLVDSDHLCKLELCMLGVEEPYHHVEALKHDAWKKSMEEELKSITENNTWDLVSLPVDVKPIRLKWVYKLKKDVVGTIVHYKARLVAKGYA